MSNFCSAYIIITLTHIHCYCRIIPSVFFDHFFRFAPPKQTTNCTSVASAESPNSRAHSDARQSAHSTWSTRLRYLRRLVCQPLILRVDFRLESDISPLQEVAHYVYFILSYLVPETKPRASHISADVPPRIRPVAAAVASSVGPSFHRN